MCIIAGSNRPQEGMEPHSIVGGGDGPQDRPIVWLWSHQSMDEAGDGAAHFSYVCEDCIAQKIILGSMLGSHASIVLFLWIV